MTLSDNLLSPELCWRPWEETSSRPVSDDGLSQTISHLQTSILGSHKTENVRRSTPLENCPSSNLHHFVKPVPHTSHEVYPSTDIRTKKSVSKGKMDYRRDIESIGFVKMILSGYDDQKRFQLASKLVTEVNHLSWKKPGDKFTTISVPEEIAGKQCFNCVLGGVCLGWNCLEKKSGV